MLKVQLVDPWMLSLSRPQELILFATKSRQSEIAPIRRDCDKRISSCPFGRKTLATAECRMEAGPWRLPRGRERNGRRTTSLAEGTAVGMHFWELTSPGKTRATKYGFRDRVRKQMAAMDAASTGQQQQQPSTRTVALDETTRP